MDLIIASAIIGFSIMLAAYIVCYSITETAKTKMKLQRKYHQKRTEPPKPIATTAHSDQKQQGSFKGVYVGKDGKQTQIKPRRRKKARR